MQTLTEKLQALLKTKKFPSPEEWELFEKAQTFTEYIRWIPGLRMVAVSNSLAMYATHKNSDIDLFIVTAPERLWIVRTLVLIIATLLGVRTKPGNEAGKFCFPFFMTEKNLSLKNIALTPQPTPGVLPSGASPSSPHPSPLPEGEGERRARSNRGEFSDVYLAYWIITLKPIFNKNYTYGRFMEVNRAFCENTLQTEFSQEARGDLLQENRTFLIPVGASPGVTRFWDIFSPILSLKNSFFGFVSKKYILQKIPSENTEGIVVDDDMVKIHIPDRRREVRDEILRL